MSTWVRIRNAVTSFTKEYLKPAALSALASFIVTKTKDKVDK